MTTKGKIFTGIGITLGMGGAFAGGFFVGQLLTKKVIGAKLEEVYEQCDDLRVENMTLKAKVNEAEKKTIEAAENMKTQYMELAKFYAASKENPEYENDISSEEISQGEDFENEFTDEEEEEDDEDDLPSEEEIEQMRAEGYEFYGHDYDDMVAEHQKKINEEYGLLPNQKPESWHDLSKFDENGYYNVFNDPDTQIPPEFIAEDEFGDYDDPDHPLHEDEDSWGRLYLTWYRCGTIADDRGKIYTMPEMYLGTQNYAKLKAIRFNPDVESPEYFLRNFRFHTDICLDMNWGCDYDDLWKREIANPDLYPEFYEENKNVVQKDNE